mmetsp:Transcript_13235/g.33032  ORF Transcript_13235/g.33032 Transcript_13235/m.33032 type:complete len:103 (+) Transcript_13235:71-379(+)
MWRSTVRVARARGNSMWARQFNLQASRNLACVRFGERPLSGFAEQPHGILMACSMEQLAGSLNLSAPESELESLEDDAAVSASQTICLISYMPTSWSCSFRD